jgi:hypothetical protein
MNYYPNCNEQQLGNPLANYVPDSVMYIIQVLTFHEARLISLVCQCDCTYFASVATFILPV